jgi:integrase
VISKDGKVTVSKTSYGTFKVRFYDQNGFRQSKTVSTVCERDLLVRSIRRFEDLDRWFPPEGVIGTKSLKTFKDLSEEFLLHRRGVRQISQSCLGNYETQIKQHILPVLGDIRLDLIGLRDIERLALNLMQKRPLTQSYLAIRRELKTQDQFLSAHYRREILTLACSIAKFGFERDFLASHPFKAFEMPAVGEKPFDYWRPAEEDKFLDWLLAGGPYTKEHTNRAGEKFDRPWRVWNYREVYEVVLLALKTGMRRGEITALRMDHVDFEEKVITVQDAFVSCTGKFKDTTKNGSFRRIEMNPDVEEVLLRYKDRPRNERIFEKIMTSHTLKKFSELTRKAGVREIHFHALRHTFLTNLANGIGIDAPVDILKVKELAGHSDIQTTMLYVHKIGIKDTSSLQWSRTERKNRANKTLPSNVFALKRKETRG